MFPAGHPFNTLDVITPADMATENIIHTRRDSEFFRHLSKAFQTEKAAFNSLLEIRQFTAACELVCQGTGVAVVSELDAVEYTNKGLDFRPFAPTLPLRISLVRPITQRPSMYVNTGIHGAVCGQPAALSDRDLGRYAAPSTDADFSVSISDLV